MGDEQRSRFPVRPVLLVLGALVVLLGCFAGRAGAQEDGEQIVIQVIDRTTVDGQRGRVPVEGASAVVLDSTGAEVGQGVTGADGRAIVTVPGGGTYTVRLDVEALPDDIVLEEGARSEFTPTVRPNGRATVNFFTGSEQRDTEGTFERVAQRLVDGTRLGLVIAICSVGLSLIFGTTGLTNFAHGEMVTFGGMVAFLFNVTWNWPLLVAAPVAVVIGGLFGLLLDVVLWSKLRKRGVSLVSQLVVSVGLSIFLRYLFLHRFKGRTRPFGDFSLQTAHDYGPISITNRDLITSILALVVLVAVALGLQRTRWGKATRAVADNVDLASATGIDSAKVIRMVWFLGGALAALGGIIRGLDEQVGFEMGANLLFLMFAGITLGGLGSAYGALAGGFLIGLVVELSTLSIPNELKNAPALAILVVILLLRPQGIFGRSERVG